MIKQSVYSTVSVNLELKDSDSLVFPFSDYGFLYGYGLFESIRVYRNNPVLIFDHIDRLRRGATILDIPFSFQSEAIIETVRELIRKNDVEHAILNFYLTPGNRPADPSTYEPSDPFFLMVMRPWPDYDASRTYSLELREESFQRTRLDRLKSLSWVKNVLEKKLTYHADDVMLHNEQYGILEASSANVFFIKDGIIYTPKAPMILQGITRQFLINHQKQLGYEVHLTDIDPYNLSQYDEIFLTNALKGIMLVSHVDEFNLSSKDHARRIQHKYHELIGISDS